MVKSKLKINDNVVVITGVDRGRRGKIIFIDSKNNRVVVEGVNKKKKNVKPTQENPKGGVLSIEFPVNASNVMIFCDKCKKGMRISKISFDKNKNRICKKCGKSFS